MSAVAKRAPDLRILDKGGQELMAVKTLEREGSDLLIRGKIMGAMPMTARLTPQAARAALRMLTPRLMLFLVTLPFRRS